MVLSCKIRSSAAGGTVVGERDRESFPAGKQRRATGAIKNEPRPGSSDLYHAPGLAGPGTGHLARSGPGPKGDVPGASRSPEAGRRVLDAHRCEHGPLFGG